ncbi:MAG: MATE family efflux transporter [Clostridia bacterium]|nr:MATE family efflux transporter [Clostridia bacterium]
MKVDVLNGKLNKTYFTMLFSAIASTIVTTVYSTVDMICVGHYAGPDGAASIACINPLWALMFAFGVLTGVGGAVMMSNRRGAGNEKAANEYFTVAVICCLIFSAALVSVYAIFLEPLLRLFGATGHVLELSVDYMRYMLFSVPTFTLCACFATFARNDGEALIPTVATVVGGVLNIFLDVFLVFTCDMGVRGAGLATGIGQAVAFLIVLSYFFTKKCNLKLTKVGHIPSVLSKIVTVGFAAFLIEITSGVTSAVHNILITEHLSNAHLAVYGTTATLIIMFVCLFNGIGTAMQPLIATAYGANNTERVRKTLRLAFLTAAVMSAVFFCACQLFPETILKIYMDVDASVLAVGPRIVRLYSISLLVVGFSMVCNYYFQSTLMRGACVLISMLRGLLLPILFVFTLPFIFGYDFIWLAVPAGEILTTLIALIIFIARFKSRNNLDRLIREEI